LVFTFGKDAVTSHLSKITRTEYFTLPKIAENRRKENTSFSDRLRPPPSLATSAADPRGSMAIYYSCSLFRPLGENSERLNPRHPGAHGTPGAVRSAPGAHGTFSGIVDPDIGCGVGFAD
jgi:hypothetical protein